MSVLSSSLTCSLHSYRGEMITSGLEANGEQFTINGKPIQILSGSLHYFRVMPDYWRHSILKMKYCGLNTVCTYMPWNLHEEKPGIFDFHGILDIEAFIRTIHEEDMFCILRPGPYVCAEWDFGGLPSWLLRDEEMKVRTNYPPFMAAVERYFSKVVTLVAKYQFSRSGGPLIAVQVENEFASFGNSSTNADDLEYLLFLKNLLTKLGISELLFTSDMPSLGLAPGAVPDILMTANFQTDAELELGILKKCQPNKPLMVAEFWSGWFDHWNEKHEDISLEVYEKSLRYILSIGASVNIYVFHGGTNFGFFNGANINFPVPETPYMPTVTSYDYGAPLTEAGDYTKKYFITKKLIGEFCPKNSSLSLSKMPQDLPPMSNKITVSNIPITKFLPLNKMLELMSGIECKKPIPMEMLNLDKNCGQRFGFILYRTTFTRSGIFEFSLTNGTRTTLLVDGTEIANFEWTFGVQKIYLRSPTLGKANTLDILVENLGRVNYNSSAEVLNGERRGLCGEVLLDGVPVENWTVFPLSFDSEYISKALLTPWENMENVNGNSIGLYRAQFDLKYTGDTFVHSDTWTKGILLVNGFNLGRYWIIGPQQSLFLPAPLLKEELNELWVFELHKEVKSLEFKDTFSLNCLKNI